MSTSTVSFFIGQNMKRLRGSRSQKEVGDALGLTQQSIHRIEKGKHKIAVDTAKQIADFFNVTVDFLLQDHGEEDVPSVNRFSVSDPAGKPSQKPLERTVKITGKPVEIGQDLIDRGEYNSFEHLVDFLIRTQRKHDVKPEVPN